MVNRAIAKISKMAPVALVLLSLIVAWKNTTFGTWLSGWDNLHPEFNLFLNLKRSFFAVWQEYQGVGFLSGNAHASDFPRVLILSMLSPLLPSFALRYFWTFLMLALGPLGVYFLLKESLRNRLNNSSSNFAGFVAGAFYLLNLATVQVFYTPYEAFVSFFGSLPWLIFLALNYLRQGTRKSLFLFLLVSFLTTSAFYVLTPFIVYLLVLAIFLACEAIYSKASRARSLKILAVTFAANAFWLLPAGYFALNNLGVVRGSKINSFATPETKLMNQSAGSLSDIAKLSGFWFEYSDLAQEGEFDFLLAPWRAHFANPRVELTAYALFALVVLGLLSLFLSKRRLSLKFSAIFLFILSYFMLATVNPPFGPIYSFLFDKFPFFDVAFRSPFTKWSVVAALAYALALGFLVHFWLGYLREKANIFAFSISVILVLAMVWTSLPSFQGNLIMKPVRTKIPSEYFELFEFFDHQPVQARIAFFPIHTFWGWNFYNWGYRGSGFLWYGIKQPILDRAFDVWSPHNEAFYNEISQAFYGRDKEGLARVFDKYDLAFVLIDKSVITPEQEIDFLRFDDAEEILTEIGAEPVFNKGALRVYELRQKEDKFVFAPKSYALVLKDAEKVRYDDLFRRLGDYIQVDDGEGLNGQAIFPFSDLFEEEVAGVDYERGHWGETWINIKRTLPALQEYELVIPAIESGTIYQGLSEISLKGEKLLINFSPSLRIETAGKDVELPEFANLEMGLGLAYDQVLVSINGKTVRVSKEGRVIEAFPLWAGAPIYVEVFDAKSPKIIDLDLPFSTQDINTCWEREGQEGFLDVSRAGSVLTLKVKDLVGCSSFKLGRLEGRKALLSVSLPYRSKDASRPDFCLVIEGEHECLNEEVFYATSPSKDWAKVTRNSILETDQTYWLVVSARPPDKPGHTWQIDYQAPRVESFPLVSSATFDPRVWTDLAQETRIKVPGGDIKLSFFGIKEEVDFGVTGKLEVENCDLFERGSVEKEMTGVAVVYRAKDRASVCDFSPLANISTKASYFIRLVGENISGRGLKFYLYNKAAKHNDLETLLEKGKFDQTFSILNWLFLDPETYVLNVEGRSFGEESQARLRKVEIYQAPLSWLTTWRLEPTDKISLKKAENKAEISNLRKKGTYKYTFAAEVESDPGLVVLSQGYDEGWQAYEVGNVKCQMSNVKCLLPFLFGKKLKHVKVNSWANGWLLPITDYRSPVTVLIIFWPQYLEFLGFAILITGIAWLVFLGPSRRVDKGKAEALK